MQRIVIHVTLACIGLVLLGPLQSPGQAQPSKIKRGTLEEIEAARYQIAQLKAKLQRVQQELFGDERKDEEKEPTKNALQAQLIKVLEAELKQTEAALATAIENAPVPTRDQEFQLLMEFLSQPIETKGLQEKVKLKTALEYFSDRFGGRLPILIDREAFASEFGPDAADPYEEEVSLPPVPAKMLMRVALKLVLSQVGKGQATFIVHPTYIEITTLKASAPAYLLHVPSSFGPFEKVPLKEVLSELASESGLDIHLDPAVGKQADFAVTARFRNATLESALVVITESAELKFVVLERSVFVTTPQRAEILKREEDERAKTRKEFKAIPKGNAKRLEAAAE